jgi:cell division control protein 45
VPYRLIPIGGYAELEAKRDEILNSDELHTVIVLSLGSLLPLATYFSLPAGCHLHVIDAHRPWNLENLFGLDVDGDGDEDGKIWVWGDGEENELGGVKQSWEALEVSHSCVSRDVC